MAPFIVITTSAIVIFIAIFVMLAIIFIAVFAAVLFITVLVMLPFVGITLTIFTMVFVTILIMFPRIVVARAPTMLTVTTCVMFGCSISLDIRRFLCCLFSGSRCWCLFFHFRFTCLCYNLLIGDRSNRNLFLTIHNS